MKRALILLSMLVAPLLTACGDDDGGGNDMSACGPTTCSASQFLDTKLCMCVNRDMAISHD